MQVITQLVIQVFSLFIVSSILPGFTLTDFRAAIVAAVVIGVINTFIRPIVQLIAFPITVLTLGIFSFIINVFLLMVAASIVPGFKIDGFFTAAIASIVLALISAFIHQLMRE
jgi:putative membrane protein